MQVRKSLFFRGSLLVLILIFFLQVSSAIFSNEINGFHFGKKRPRFSSPVKHSVTLQVKYDSIADIAIENESSYSETPLIKFNGFVPFISAGNYGGFSYQARDAIQSSSYPPLFTLYHTYRI